jgi:tetratricopeptide (TPR) repeat protein
MNSHNSLKTNNLSTFYTAHNLVKNVVDSLNYKSALITNHSIPQFLIWYLQIAENRASDVVAIPLEEFPEDKVIEKLLANEKDNYNIYWVGCKKTELFKERLLPNGLVFEFNLQNPKYSISEDDFDRHLKHRLAWEKELRDDPYVDDFESYAEIHKINAQVYYYYALRNDFNNALREFGELIKVNPNSATLNMFYGTLWAEKKELRKAASYFTKALRLNKNLSRGRFFELEKSNAMLAIGITFLIEERYGDAIKIFTLLTAETPSPFTTHYYLGLALIGDNRQEEALEELKLASSLRPADEELRENIEKLQGVIDRKRSDTN